jgi:hypothetical protein
MHANETYWLPGFTGPFPPPLLIRIFNYLASNNITDNSNTITRVCSIMYHMMKVVSNKMKVFMNVFKKTLVNYTK